MGIKIFIDVVTHGVGSQMGIGSVGANTGRLTNVLGNVLPGTIASVAIRSFPTGVVAGTFTGRLTTSRLKNFTGTSATGGVGTLTTGSNATPWGFNISGMEWNAYARTRGSRSTAPNRDYTIPRDELVHFLANRGFRVTRLPFLWENIQPVLASRGAQSVILNAYGITASGQLAPQIVRMISQVLAGHAAAGIKCVIDMHNYCRYIDFLWNADGSVTGFTNPGSPGLPFTSPDATFQRIMSTTGQANAISQSDYADVWTRIATQFKGTAGLGGYMIMNEPHDLDNNNTWPIYAQVAINAIRAVDASVPIYVGGNNFSNSTSLPTSNPGFPLSGVNLIYEAHMYLDATSSGNWFDWDQEVAKGFSVGEVGSINASTGFNRLKFTTDWLTSNVQKGAVTECGLPLDDTRWDASFKSALDLAWTKGLEWYTWMCGDHWPIHGFPINAVPTYYQQLPHEAKVGGLMRQSMGLQLYSLFDSSPSFGNGAAGQVVTVTLYCQGYVSTSFNITVTRTVGAGTLSTGTVVMPTGANPSVTYTYTAAVNEVATLTYSGPSQVPPARKIYNLTDPVAFAATSLTDAGRALLAKYGCAEWVAVNGAKDYMGVNAGIQATDGDYVRGIWDSGFASKQANAFGMMNWVRLGSDYGTMTPPTKAISAGHHKLDTQAPSSNNWGTTLSQSVNAIQGNLNKVEAFVWDASNPSMAFDQVASYSNVAIIWAATFAGPVQNTNNNGDGSLEFKFFGNVSATQVQSIRSRGSKVIMAVGGASNGYNITTRQQSTNFVNTFITLAGQLGGLDGISLEFFQAGVGSSANEVLFIVQSLRAQFGASFLVTSMPDPASAADQNFLSTLFSNGGLSWAMPQYFQSATWVANTAGIITNLDTWKALFGGSAAAVMAAFPCNNNLNQGPTVAECNTVYTTYVATNPTFRGVIGWTAQINLSSTSQSGGGNVWGMWCKKQDIKEQNGGVFIQPNGKEVTLFDLHDPQFIISAVELQNTSSDGGIFSTNKAEDVPHNELGMTFGGIPRAVFSDFNANTITLQPVSGLAAGAHVVSAQSTGSAQTLRVDKVQVASGARTLTANTAESANTHTIGWTFYSFFERGTPGCYIYGVIAGKGNPTTSELTVMERYLGNTFAGLSL